jgi:hypothetical protein
MKVGRPPKYETLEDMIPALQEWEKSIQNGEVPTITGLTLSLGFADKSSLYDYAKNDKFSHSIKRAMLIVENGYEKALRESNAAGSIFALKNMGWKDRQEIDHSNQGGKFTGFTQVEVIHTTNENSSK